MGKQIAIANFQNKIDTIDFELEFFEIEKLDILDEFILKVRGRVLIADEANLKDLIMPKEELKIKYKTLENMPLNINHQQDLIIGTITKADFIYPENKKNPEVWIYAVIWEFLKPDLGSRIRQVGASKRLSFSIEVFCNFAICPICQKKLDYTMWKAGVDLCEHWKSSNLRIASDFVFIGCALLLPPAQPAVKKAKAELHKVDLTKITRDYLKKLSNEELLKLHKELHDEFAKFFGTKH